MLNNFNIIAFSEFISYYENCKLMAYKCPSGFLTIGFGHNLDTNPITISASLHILYDDISFSLIELNKIFPRFLEINQPRQIVLTDLMFNLGSAKFKTFKNMISCILQNNWPGASDQLMYSDPYVYPRIFTKYFLQNSIRATKNCEILKSGNF